MSKIDPQLIFKLNQPVPRYTSYPTAPEWSDLDPAIYAQKLQQLSVTKQPISLYFHIPFCHSMCLYCGCSVVLNRKPENEECYVDYLCQEIDLVCSHLGYAHPVSQVHFGGGTPTKLSIPLFGRLFEKIHRAFSIDYSKELAIEIDPRTVREDQGKKLKFLRKIGFNRVSFGVQDTNPVVQEAVKRRQSLETTLWTYDLARQLEFDGVNIDLIYGLPFQTVTSFHTTVDHILSMRPNRIAFFSYAKVPWLKPHQKAIKEETLPSTEEKFLIYAQAREKFMQNGYVAIGMDHFALEEDEIAQAYKNKQLQRNFQGYAVKLAEEMLCFGVSSIGFTQNTYAQNLKTLDAYYHALDQKQLPIHRGKELSEDDQIRKWVIHTLMCDFELDKKQFFEKYNVEFDLYFADALLSLNQYVEEGLVIDTPEMLHVTPIGELFVRVIASCFDAYLKSSIKPQSKFSYSV